MTDASHHLLAHHVESSKHASSCPRRWSSPFFPFFLAMAQPRPRDFPRILDLMNSVEVCGLPEVFIPHEKDVRLDL